MTMEAMLYGYLYSANLFRGEMHMMMMMLRCEERHRQDDDRSRREEKKENEVKEERLW